MNEKLSYSFWLFPLVAVSSLGLDIFIPALPEINATFESTQKSAQLLISIYVFALSIGQLLSGPFIDKYGCQRVFLVGISVCGSASILIVLADSFFTLVTLRFFQGLGAGSVAVSVFASVPKVFNKQINGKVFSLFSSVLSTVPVLAPILGGYLTAAFDWRACFTFLALYMIVCMLINFIRPLPSMPCSAKGSQNLGLASYAKLLSNRSFIIGSMACSLGFSTQLVFFSSSPLVIISQFNFNTEDFGYIFAINALSITAGSLLVVKLIGKFSEESIIKTGAVVLLMAGICFIVFRMASNATVWHYIGPSCLGSFGFALLMSAGTTLALSEFSKLSGKASSLNGALQLILASLFSLLVMRFWDAEWKVNAIFYVCCGLTIIASTFLPKTTSHNKSTEVRASHV